MSLSLDELKARVRAQKTLIPSLYGNVDFDIVPERFTAERGVRSMLPAKLERKYRAGILADKPRVERLLAYTLLGDTVADAYAALTPKYGFRPLIDMLVKASEKGIDAVPGAPPELAAFIASMERIPDWLDRELVEEGARHGRIAMANLTPFAIRGAFIATFLNKYSGLPMALTGALSQESSVQRVKETASFFTTATLPGALNRHGSGFRAAAMVRLMHSMVRFHVLRSPKWDVSVYGIPIPQIDQMPAGTMPSFITAFKVVREGRDRFTRREQAIVEFCRYQCYLLGLPEELLPDTPRGIFDAMLSYAATLRDGYDDETNGELVRATMAAYLPLDETLKSRIFDTVEKSYSKVFFRHTFQVPRAKAVRMGAQPSLLDYGLFAASSVGYILPRMVAHTVAERIPVVNRLADRLLVREINELLVSYGHAEYTTDPSKYKDATPRPPAHAHG